MITRSGGSGQPKPPIRPQTSKPKPKPKPKL